MARRSRLPAHRPPPQRGGFLDAALAEHADALAELRRPAPGDRRADEMFRAAVEIRRDHRAWGYQRRRRRGHLGRDLPPGPQGQRRPWWSARSCSPALHRDADRAPARHARRLRGARRRLAAAPDGRRTVPERARPRRASLAAGQRAVGGPDRVHVLVADPRRPADLARALGELVGFDADATAAARRRGRRRPAGRRHAAADRRAHRRPARPGRARSTLAEHWTKVVADGGYDVLGDLRDLVAGAVRPLDRPGARGVDDARRRPPRRARRGRRRGAAGDWPRRRASADVSAAARRPRRRCAT